MENLHFYFDPACPFAWLASKWVRLVQAQRGFDVEWRLISLRLLNVKVEYDSHFPPGYEAGHNAGLRALRVAAAVRAEFGVEAVDRYYRAFGEHTFEIDPPEDEMAYALGLGGHDHVAPVLAAAGLPARLAAALEDASWDEVLQAETDEALALTGRDVGTPLIHFGPPDGPAISGPVISRDPEPDSAVELWDHVVALAHFPGFAEIKRSLRERPQLPVAGVRPGEAGLVEDWHQGSRRLKR